MEIVRPVIRDPLLRHALLGLFAQLDAWNGAPGANGDHALACEEALVHTCGLLLDRHGSTAQPPEASAEIQQVRDRLADDPLEPPTLTQMAAMVELSKFQLLRRFEKVYGLTPYAWLLHRRAELASRQIRAGASLADAAASSGFADQSHMTRVFARQFGFTPGALRQASRA
jgi:AraC-like DNA-binding protein